MLAKDIEPYIGLTYCRDTFDCADFVLLVQKELFNREVMIPNGRPRGVIGQVKLGQLSQQYAKPTSAPVDGDLVLMHNGAGWHVGVYLFIANEPHVLHCRSEGGGFSIVQPLRESPLRIEGIYTWI